MTGQARTVLISDRIDAGHPALAQYARHYDLWLLARQRDAMAYIQTLPPELMIVDLDMEGLEVDDLVRAVRQQNLNGQTVLVGLSRNTAAIPDHIVMAFDRILPIQA